jgi:hypothetical protein
MGYNISNIQDLLYFSLLTENMKIEREKNWNFELVLYENQDWSLIAREENKLRVLGNRQAEYWGECVHGPKAQEGTSICKNRML